MKITKITVLGAGGHGVMSLKDLFSITDLNFDIFYNTTDWGGSYGLWGRLLENNKQELNQKLHHRNQAVLPFADPNKLLCFYCDKKNINAKDFFDFRSNIYLEHIDKINVFFSKIIQINNQKERFMKYFETSWLYYQQNKNKLKYENEICLGYIYQSFIFDDCKNIKGWNNFYHNIKILPQNINLKFSCDQRTILTGRDISLEYIVGEDKLDTYTSPILPDSLSIIDYASGQKAKCNIDLLNSIEISDFIIIPNGSMANWLPLTNDPDAQKLLQNKRIIWITNPYRTHNELINPNYYLYLKEIGLNVIPLSQKNGIQNEGFYNILEQDKQGKYKSKNLADNIIEIMNK
jgi:hypothetical protein